MKMKCEKLLRTLVITLVCACNALATNEGSLDQQIQTIKQQALELNRDLVLLEEELRFPNDSRLALFLSLDAEAFFSLQAVTLSIDGRQVMHHLYTPRQLDALLLGGIHRLYMGNVKAGKHGILAVFTGRGPEGREYQRATEVTLEKTSGAQNLELEITDSTDLQQPAFAVHAADSLRYGTTLFYYFQQDYFNALTELMVAQQLDELDVQGDKAEFLRGGVSLSYGMERAAEQIFERLLTEPGASIDRDRAWFYLGKLAWERADLDRSAAALDKMAPAYQGQLTPEANYLRASISLRRGKEQLAASYETLLPADSPWLYYHYYNLAASHAARGEWTAAVGYFQRVIESPLSTPEIRSLRDKALTASGYAYLATENYEQAAGDFTRVRLDSPLVDRALLGYGWAHSEMGDYRSAMSPWQVLAERSLMSDSVREGLLALAYAHEQLGRQRDALAQYRHAAQVYEAKLATVQAAIELFRDDGLPQQLGLAEDNSQDWLHGQDMLPRGEHLPYLRHLVSRHNFQLALRELRDLHSMTRYLYGASQRLNELSGEDHAQQSAHAPRIRDLQQRARSQELQVQSSLQDARARVSELAITELQQQAGKLQRALGQSRLAVARLYDAGSPKVQP